MSSDENVESENPAAGDDRFGPLTWVPARSGVYGLDHGATPPPTIPMLNFDEIMRLQHGRANPGAPSAFAQYPPAPIASGYVAYSPRSVSAPWVPNAQPLPPAPPMERTQSPATPPLGAVPFIAPQSPIRSRDIATGDWPKHIGPARAPFEHANAITGAWAPTAPAPVQLAPAAPRPIAAADEDEDLDDSPLMPLPPALPFDMPPPPPKPADAALRNAVGLAWTALLLAVIIPPVGIVLGWYCISVTRETVVQDSVGIANQVKLVSYASMVVGCLATLGVISMLF